MENPSRLERLIGELRQFYGLLPTPPADGFRFFVWQVLSYKSTPGQRASAFNILLRNRALTPDSLEKLAPKKMLDAIAATGSYHEQRQRALKAAIRVFQLNPDLTAAIGGDFAVASEAISLLPRIDPETTFERLLLYVGGHRVFPQDEGVGRVLRRLGYDEPPESELEQSVDAYRRACTYLTHHASTTCTENDPHCSVCPLRSDCPYAGGSQVGSVRL